MRYWSRSYYTWHTRVIDSHHVIVTPEPLENTGRSKEQIKKVECQVMPQIIVYANVILETAV
jgi:hypothetical protein